LTLPCHADPPELPGEVSAGAPVPTSIAEFPGVAILRVVFVLLGCALLLALPAIATSQSESAAENSPNRAGTTIAVTPDLTYVRPTSAVKARNYVFDVLGPYPIAGSAVAAGINQWTNSPPEWRQGAEGYGRRFASNFGIATVGTTARYGLAAVFKEDTLYYRCECSGLSPRMRHALISSFTARRGLDGHRVFSIAAIAAPYAGSAAAVYGWYPDRFGAKDAFRMGNYTLLAGIGENIALEFLFGGPHSLLSALHLHPKPDAPVEGPQP